jgi:ribonuclease E
VKRTATRSRTTSTRRRASSADAAQEAAPEATTAIEPTHADEPIGEGRTAPESVRLPMTALLFQAPDPSAVRPKGRRAQAPAGPPGSAPVASTGAAEAVEELLATTRTTPGTRSGRGARTARVVQAEPTDQAASDETTEGAEVSRAADLSPAADESEEAAARRRRRRGGRGRRGRGTGHGGSEDERGTVDEHGAEGHAVESPAAHENDAEGEAADESEGSSSSRRRRRRRRGGHSGESGPEETSAPTRTRGRSDEVTALKGSTRLEAKRQRRREGRDAGRRRTIVTEAEFLARRESVERSMIVRESDGRTQIAVLEDNVLVEHYVSRKTQTSTVGNVYLGRVQNVLPSMEAAFVDVGKGRNAVLYAGEVNWDAAGLDGQPRRIEQALNSGDSVMVQVTKDPIGHKGSRLTAQVTLAGRYLVFVPNGAMTGISRKLPENERARLKKLLKEIVPEGAGVIVRTAAEGASEDELRRDMARLTEQWADLEKKAKTATAPALLHGEPELSTRVVRDIFNEDISSLTISGAEAWTTISEYVSQVAPDLADRLHKWTGTGDVFAAHRVDEQLAKGMDRKVWLPSGGSLVIDRTEAMTVIDVNTGKFTGSGGTLEETVTRNNLEAAEEIVRQLRLRDIGGMIVIDFIDMVLESNRDLVLRRLIECLGRDRTKHQVAEVTSLGLVQMTRKRVGQGLVEAFSETCEHCNGRGFIVHTDPVERKNDGGAAPMASEASDEPKRSRRKRKEPAAAQHAAVPVLPEPESEERAAVKATLAAIAAAAAHAHEHDESSGETVVESFEAAVDEPVAGTETVADAAVDGIENPGKPASGEPFVI